MGRREAILEGTQAAQRLHATLGTRAALERGNVAGIDVFRVAVQQGATLLFRRLQGLLGAYLTQPVTPVPGIIVSTERPLHIQRFTAAHELGHLHLGHKASFDEQVGLWRGGVQDLQEVAADAFASEFLLPQWLYVHHARRHRWHADDFASPEVAYQLSLRLGASYEATCWGLQSHKILPAHVVGQLRAQQPKSLKLAALGSRVQLSNPWADVWTITPPDDGLTFEGSPDDIVIFRCHEHSSAGYLWDESRLVEQGFELLVDLREEDAGDECGSEVVRVLIARATEAREYSVVLSERRPWHPDDSIARLTVGFDLQGKEQGLPRFQRKGYAAA